MTWKFIVTSLGELIREDDILDLGQLKPKEKDIARVVYRLQKINGDRFRVYGGITRSGKVSIKLVTEFLGFVDARGKEFWKDVRELLKQTKAKLWVMDERECLDKVGMHTVGKGAKTPAEITSKFAAEGRRLVNNGKPDAEGMIWSLGRDHGRPEKQVEFSWEVGDLTLRQLRARIRSLSKSLDPIWKGSDGVGGGVSVI
jgi:hypothetical protein